MVLGDEAHVTNLLIAPESRRQRIGSRLLSALIVASIEFGARHLTLEVRSRNHAARKMYAGFGLAPVGLRKGYYGDDDALILWASDIDSNDYRERLEGLR
jgi:ribosomal-protein-alanine N-acetyltransferase